MTSRPNASPAVIVTTAGELEQFITAAVAKALAEQREDAAPELLDREGLARALGCSAGQVDKLRKEGLPTVRLGDSPRFVLRDVLAWLPRTSQNAG